MKKKSKVLIGVAALILVAILAIGATLAYLSDTSGPVTNTFTIGKVKIELKEHKLDTDGKTLTTGTANEVTSESGYTIIPGTALNKDPFVRVLANSEKCWVFVKITQTNWNEKLTYAVDTGWAELESAAGTGYKVYYTTVEKATAAQEINILKDKKITVAAGLAQTEITDSAKPQLVFDAYAIQFENLSTAAAAWDALSN